MKKMLTAISFALTASVSFAQDTEQIQVLPKEKKFDHYVGAQVNGLIRQVFNFSDANNPTNNPYLLTYNINFRKSGWGLRVGGGYEKRFVASNDGVTDVESDINNYQARLGVEKRFQLSGRWTAGVGIDGIYGNDVNNTTTITTAFDTVTVKSKNSVNTMGGGVMAWLRYSITDNIFIGTETSYYQRYGSNEIKTTITQRQQTFPGTGTVITTTSKKDHDLAEGVISLPVVFYLVVKF